MEQITVVKTGACSIGATVALGATSYGAYNLIQPRTIGEKIAGDGGVLLGEEDVEIGEENAKKYNYIGNRLDSLSLVGATEKQKIEELKRKCEKALNEHLTHNEKVDDNRAYEVKKGCARIPEVKNN